MPSGMAAPLCEPLLPGDTSGDSDTPEQGPHACRRHPARAEGWGRGGTAAFSHLLDPTHRTSTFIASRGASVACDAAKHQLFPAKSQHPGVQAAAVSPRALAGLRAQPCSLAHTDPPRQMHPDTFPNQKMLEFTKKPDNKRFTEVLTPLP